MIPLTFWVYFSFILPLSLPFGNPRIFWSVYQWENDSPELRVFWVDSPPPFSINTCQTKRNFHVFLSFHWVLEQGCCKSTHVHPFAIETTPLPLFDQLRMHTHHIRTKYASKTSNGERKRRNETCRLLECIQVFLARVLEIVINPGGDGGSGYHQHI